MDRAQAGPAGPGKASPGNTPRPIVAENGKWQKKILGKGGKTIMMICLE
jgi:hypothetical protein